MIRVSENIQDLGLALRVDVFCSCPLEKTSTRSGVCKFVLE